jgi:hypothetical protein
MEINKLRKLMEYPKFDLVSILLEKGWRHASFSNFQEDEGSWTDPKTGEIFPPSNYHAAFIFGQREDLNRFFVRIVVHKEEENIEAISEDRNRHTK